MNSETPSRSCSLEQWLLNPGRLILWVLYRFMLSNILTYIGDYHCQNCWKSDQPTSIRDETGFWTLLLWKANIGEDPNIGLRLDWLVGELWLVSEISEWRSLPLSDLMLWWHRGLWLGIPWYTSISYPLYPYHSWVFPAFPVGWLMDVFMSGTGWIPQPWDEWRPGAFKKVYGSQQRRGTCTNVFVRSP